ncbi:MAG: hypothetical protein DWP92_01865 [Armatimonadetes bacterium]|nr:MAG: hypothetical protein DWP92_01865 [Armatimonadota bacterium]
MTEYMIDGEFDVRRRLGWDDSDDLATHLDEVAEVLTRNSEVTRVETEGNLDSGRVYLKIYLDSWEINRVEHSRSVVGVAIRAAGGRHDGLLPEREVSGGGAEKGLWSPFWGATWTVRRFELTDSSE